jgi:predicted O-methyltransferase YrrM
VIVITDDDLVRPPFPVRALPAIGAADDDLALLRQVPSETTLAERLLIHHLARTAVVGGRDICEIGPFLGGTTRALALGLERAGTRAPAARVRTFDRFDAYYERDALAAFVEGHDRDGSLAAVARTIRSRPDAGFLDAFWALHGHHPYASRIDARRGVLPGRPAEVAALAAEGVLFRPEPDARYGLVFVDGAKSWLGTKWFLRAVLPHTAPGSLVVFQDFCWYTCFWVTWFVQRCSEHLHYVGGVDDTRAFLLSDPDAAAALVDRLPDAPEDLPLPELIAPFRALAEQAVGWGDEPALVIAQLHAVAALAYVGQTGTARGVLDSLRSDHDLARRYARLLEGSAQSPTYTPEGPVRW